MKIFENLKVIELASVLAGPSVGMFFAELGAKVIKFENKNAGGDVTRNWKLPSESDDAISAYFSSVNYHKEHVFVDYNNNEDLTKVKELIASADIVICNFKEGYDLKFGLDYESLKQMNPLLIYAQLSGFISNPKKVAFDVVLQAECGYMAMNGQPASPPTKMPLAFMDILAAHQLKEGILTALYKRSLTNEGSLVRTSLEESALASLCNQASNYLMVNHIPSRIGSKHPNIAPYGEVFKTQDNSLVVLAIGSDQQFKKLCDLFNSQLYLKENYANNTNRVKHRNELENELTPEFLKWNADELIDKCLIAQIPIGKVKNMKDVFESKTAQDMILEEVIENQLTRRIKTAAFHLS